MDAIGDLEGREEESRRDDQTGRRLQEEEAREKGHGRKGCGIVSVLYLLCRRSFVQGWTLVLISPSNCWPGGLVCNDNIAKRIHPARNVYSSSRCDVRLRTVPSAYSDIHRLTDNGQSEIALNCSLVSKSKSK